MNFRNLYVVFLTLACVTSIRSGVAAYTYAPVTAAMQQHAAALQTVLNANGPVSNTWVYDHLAQLADDYGPRFSGSDALEAALDWVVETAQREGGNGTLYNVTTEPVMVPAWHRGAEWATLRTPTRNKTLHMVGLGMSNNTGGRVITADVLVVGSYADLVAQGTNAIGKIIVFNVPFTTYGQTVQVRSACGTWAAAAGGVAALIRSVAPYSMQSPHTGATHTAAVPAAAISIEDATQLQRLFNRNVPLQISLYMEMMQLPDRLSRNVILQIDGASKPQEFVVFGGHSDTWDIAEGAMDDGGGILSAWGAIHFLGSLNIRVARTVRAVLWVNEENGDQGGQAYARDHAAELNFTSLAIESDEGAFSPYTLAFTGNDAAFNQLLLLSQLVEPLGAGNVSRGGGGTDIDPMCQLGVPCSSMPPRDPRATNYSNNPCRDMMSAGDFENGQLGSGNNGIPAGYFWFHHTASDTMDRMDAAQLQRYSVVMAIWAMSVADLPELLPRVGVAPPLPPAPTPPQPDGAPQQESDFMRSIPTVLTSAGAGLLLGALVASIVCRCCCSSRRLSKRSWSNDLMLRE